MMVNPLSRKFNWDRPYSRQWFTNIMLVVLGSLIIAAGYVLFIIPYKLVPGGLIGLSIIVNQLVSLPIGIGNILLNLPLLLLSIRWLGANFGAKTIISMITTSVGIDVMTHFLGTTPITEDILVSTVFGGVTIGLGIALVLQGKASTGGTVVIAQLLTRIINLPVGRLVLYVDGLIVVFSFIAFRQLDLLPYAIIAITAISRSVDAALNGMDSKKAVMIVSQEHQKIRQFILERLNRGGTYIQGHGLYNTEQDRNIIFSALRRRELTALRREIQRIDPEAFVTVFDTQEVIGSGFRR